MSQIETFEKLEEEWDELVLDAQEYTHEMYKQGADPKGPEPRSVPIEQKKFDIVKKLICN